MLLHNRPDPNYNTEIIQLHKDTFCCSITLLITHNNIQLVQKVIQLILKKRALLKNKKKYIVK